MRKFYSLTLLGIISSVVCLAQNAARISGRVNDETEKGLNATTVSLLRVKDSSLVKLAVADRTGNYEFVNVPEGKYLLAFSQVGYEKKFSQALEVLSNQNVEVPTVPLLPVAKGLSGVTVQSTKPFIESKLDKTVVNVEASPTSAGATALEILEKSPGIMVSSEGAISLRGKQGVIVMMDGKPTYLSPGDLANLLKNMPASALDQIEIMTNPSSKFDASGNSGVINIKTKKGKANGFNGSFMVGYTTSIYRPEDKTYFMPKSQNSFNFNYRKNKLNLFGNYNPNVFRGRNTMDISSRMIYNNETVGYTNQLTHFKFGNENQTLKLGLDWYANNKNIFGIVASGFAFNGHPTPTTINNIRRTDGTLRQQLISYIDNDLSFKNFTGNLNWKHNFDSAGHELSADFDLVKYRNLSEMLLTTDVYDGNLDFQKTSLLQGRLPADIDIYSFKADYVKPVGKGRFEAGFKTSVVRNENIVEYENHDGVKWVKDDIRSNHFIYEENINAAYATINRQKNKWTMQAGLRVENTISTGNQVTSKIKFKRDRTDLFPTAFVSYAADKKNTLTLSFGRRIMRPNYQDLNPFVFFLDTLSFRQGNIYLTPQYTNNMELSHSFLGKFITTLSYNNTTDVISQIIKPKEGTQGQIRYLTPDNVATFRNVALSVTAPLKPAKWWNANVFSNVYNNHYEGRIDTTDISLTFTSFMVNVTNTFTIAKGFTAELSGFYRHKNIDNLSRMEPIYQMSVGAQKQILKGKGTVRLNVRDPFAWQKFEGLNQYASVDMHFRSRPDLRQLTTTFTYRFGQNGQNNQPRRRNTSSQDEQSRVGQGGQ